MLNNIHLQNVASYGDECQTLASLNVVNFIFGDNGSGKSTIARLLENDQLPQFENCSLDWVNYENVETFVYNKKFVDETLREKVKGVFTLGEKAGLKQDELDIKIAERKKKEDKIHRQNENLENKRNEMAKEEERFKNKCWSLKLKHEAHFDEAFIGSKNKELFKIKCLQHLEDELEEGIDELKQLAETFFGGRPVKINILPKASIDGLAEVETQEIFKLKIIGKEDVSISGLIKRLGNSDWIRRGIGYLADEKQCPFCQQEIPGSLKQDFEDYFDETFNQKMNELKDAIAGYTSSFSGLLDYFKSLAHYENQFFSFESIRGKIDTIRAKYEKNQELLNKKLGEPSFSVEPDKLFENISEVIEVVNNVNSEIEKYNVKIDNFEDEKFNLVKKVWAFLGSQAKEYHDDHLKVANPIRSTINEMELRLKSVKDDLEKLSDEIKEIERDITSTAPSKDGINNILANFGFDNFKLEDAEEGYYRIVRSDGTFAQDTLSEGERTFITFLYFYQLIQGSTSQDSVSIQKVVVFDDPVSSLDSKVLFIVSTLIRGLFCSDALQRLNILQLFILTHNVYFHKEVSFTGGLGNVGTSPLRKHNFRYWIVRKQSGTSRLYDFEKNPVKTNYQLLWQEVKRCEENPGYSINICNTLRRILENYFKVLGGIDLTGLSEEFEGDEKFVFRSLTSWMHDGSHCMYDGIDIGFGRDLADQYLPVFKKIFEKKDHLSHYEMMMNDCE